MTDHGDSLQRATLRVLEDWAMMLVDPLEPSTTTNIFEGPTLFRSSVEFKGPRSGKVSIIAPREFLTQLKDNLLGDVESSEDSYCYEEDGFREMANVLAGNYLTEAFGNELVFDLMSPAIQQLDPATLNASLGQTATVYFRADETPLLVACNLD